MGRNGLTTTRAGQQKTAPDSTLVLRMIKERIAVGQYQPGTWLSPQRELAEEFGVDRSAIRTALSNLVSEGLIEHRKGCRPLIRDASNPRMHQRQGPRTVERIAALVFHQEHFSGIQPMLKAINRRLQDAGERYDMIVIDTEAMSQSDVAKRECAALAAFEAREFSGAIFWHTGGDESMPCILSALSAGAPMVFVDRFPDGVACDFVGVDDWQMSRDAVEHLFELGHSRIAYVGSAEQVSTTRLRCEGFVDAMKTVTGKFDPDYLCVPVSSLSDDAKNVVDAVDRLLALPAPPQPSWPAMTTTRL